MRPVTTKCVAVVTVAAIANCALLLLLIAVVVGVVLLLELTRSQVAVNTRRTHEMNNNCLREQLQQDAHATLCRVHFMHTIGTARQLVCRCEQVCVGV